MKKNVQTFLLVILFSPLFSQTNVGGIISTNTTWNLAGSPYVVTQNTLVDLGVSLTVDAGVTVKFNTTKVLQVKGTLRSIGTTNDKIYFTSNAANPVAGDWGYISFEDQSANYDTVTGSGCVLKNCVIEFGGYGNSAVIKVVSSSPLMDSCYVKNNLGSALSTLSSQYQMQILNCEIADNGGFATGNYRIFNNNYVHDNGLGSSYSFSGNTARNNIFYNNENFGFSGTYIEKNIFLKNYSGSSSGLIINPTKLKNNIISENTLSYSSTSLIAIGSQSVGLELSVNQIYRNEGGLIGYPASFGSFNNNTIHKNDYAPAFYGILGLANHYNNFSENFNSLQNLYEVRVGPSNANLENNYWGTTEDSVIQERIYDWFDDANLGFADYTPFLLLPDTIAPISPPMNVTKTDLGGGNIQIAWSQNIESDLAGYKIYWKPKNCCSFYNVIDVSNVSSYTISGISFSDTIAVTAYDNSMDGIDDMFDGNESWFSFDPFYYQTDVKQFENQKIVINVSPNPTTGIFSFSSNLPSKSFSLIIQNIFGEIIFSTFYTCLPDGKVHQSTFDIDISNYPSGIYFITLHTGNSLISKKIIVTK